MSAGSHLANEANLIDALRLPRRSQMLHRYTRQPSRLPEARRPALSDAAE
jgi:hypothetical protein